MKITIVSGARPNFMKIAPLCRAIDAAREAGKNISYRIVYTGPQDDTTLDASLFSDLAMRKPDAYLGISGRDHSQVAAAIMLAFERRTPRPSGACGGRHDRHHELRHRSQEARTEGGARHSRHALVRHEHAA